VRAAFSKRGVSFSPQTLSLERGEKKELTTLKMTLMQLRPTSASANQKLKRQKRPE